MSDAFISIRDLHHTYPNGFPALAGISLDIGRGEFVAIVGSNGSGKSTLAKHLNAVLLPTQGTVTVNGLDTRERANWLPIREQVGLVFQNPDNQIVATIVEEDVAFGLENRGIPRPEMHRRVETALRQVGIWELRHRAPHLLSGGQKQRLAIAGVLALGQVCLVLDEATSMLDAEGRQEVQRATAAVKAQGLTLVAITHRMEEVALADRVVVLHEGRVALEGTPAQVFGQPAALAAYGLAVPEAARLAHHLARRLPQFPAHLYREDELIAAILQRAGVA